MPRRKGPEEEWRCVCGDDIFLRAIFTETSNDDGTSDASDGLLLLWHGGNLLFQIELSEHTPEVIARRLVRYTNKCFEIDDDKYPDCRWEATW